jgi:hypothetical protein
LGVSVLPQTGQPVHCRPCVMVACSIFHQWLPLPLPHHARQALANPNASVCREEVDSGSCARAKVEVAKWGNTLKPESRWQDRRRAHGMALAASSHGFHTEQGSAKLQAEPTPVWPSGTTRSCVVQMNDFRPTPQASICQSLFCELEHDPRCNTWCLFF